MGPIELSFVIIVIIFCVVGLVRGHNREFGVTIALLLLLFFIEFTEAMAPKELRAVVAYIAGTNPVTQQNILALIWSGLLVVLVLVAYQVEIMKFHGTNLGAGVGLGAGLLNGYLFAGSLWFFLGRADWPYLNVAANYSELYRVAWRLLPPNVLAWPYLLALAIVMVILRAWK
jgi:hypothetical protein